MAILIAGRARRIAISVLFFCAAVVGAQIAASEHELKAAFLLNFARFVDWTDLPPGAPVRICIAGKDPFGKTLDEVIGDRQAGGHPIAIRRIAAGAPCSECQIIFVAASEKAHFAEIVALAQRQRALTVSDADSFLESGGAIRLLAEDRRVWFELNLDAANRAGLNLSSQLLRVARVVKGSSK